MGVTETLRREHEAARTALDRMRCLTDEHASEPATAGRLEDCMEYLCVAYDLCHNSKEDAVLFPALRSIGGPSCIRAIAELRADHTAGRTMLARMAEAVSLWDTVSARARNEFAHWFSCYCVLLGRHLAIEEEVLYRVAEHDLPPEIASDVASGFVAIEQERLGGSGSRHRRVRAQWLLGSAGADVGGAPRRVR